jgi:hypothetical protein
MIEFPVHHQVGGFLVLCWDPGVHRHDFAGNIEVGPDTALVEEEEVAEDVGFEDGNRESEISFNYVGAPGEGFFNPFVAAFIRHKLNMVAWIALDTCVCSASDLVVDAIRTQFVPELFRDAVVLLLFMLLHRRRVLYELEGAITEHPEVVTNYEDASGEECMISKKVRKQWVP